MKTVLLVRKNLLHRKLIFINKIKSFNTLCVSCIKVFGCCCSVVHNELDHHFCRGLGGERVCGHQRTPLANQSSSLSRILALARETEWDGLSRLMWLETSEWIELGRRCSRNLDLRDLSVSPLYDSLQGLSSLASLISQQFNVIYYTTRILGRNGIFRSGEDLLNLLSWTEIRSYTSGFEKSLRFFGHTLDVRNSHALRRKPGGWLCPSAWWFLWFLFLLNGPFRISAFSQRGGNMTILLFLILFCWNNCVSSMTKCSYTHHIISVMWRPNISRDWTVNIRRVRHRDGVTCLDVKALKWLIFLVMSCDAMQCACGFSLSRHVF